ncbi:MAG: TIGR01777 family oxidoreductase [Blastocatellia bacterium]|nr:TIGR01777 family oxidoreductase [Blastocatellia bacterium]
MKIALTGATGLIGKRLCERLAGEGHELSVLSRRPDGAKLVKGARGYRWSPEEEPAPREALEGIDAVIHLAGEPVAAGRWTEEQKRRIRDSRVTGTRNLVDGIKRVTDRPKILVSSSAVGFYGNRGDEVLDETSRPGTGYLSEVCEAWEREAGKAEELGMRVSMVRIGVVLAPDGGALEKMLTPFKFGLGGNLSDGRQWFPWIHIDDIVGILRHALLSPNLRGPVNGVAPGVVRNEEFTRELASALHRPTFFPVPEFALRIVMGEMASVVLASQRVTPSVARETGYEFHYPELRGALEAVLRGAR